MDKIIEILEKHAGAASLEDTNRLLGALIQPDQTVGHVYSMSYGTALVQVHDHQRGKAGGIPGLSFLIATRKEPKDELDFENESASVLLLRVLDASPLPTDREAERLRVEAAQRVTGTNETWDSPENIDAFTFNTLGFAGLKCRILGTFYVVRKKDKSGKEVLNLQFGSDISNFYSNSALKAYKPNGSALEIISNYLDPELSFDPDLVSHRVEIGNVRYASTARQGQNIEKVRVSIAPTDLLNMKTALFGMTRTGKSNTTKILVKSIFELRHKLKDKGKIGQLIFDINGEYANVNVQDDDSAIKNVWKSNPAGKKEDVSTYGLIPHPNDPDRNLLKINFFADDMLGVGKLMLDKHLEEDKAQFVSAFKSVDLINTPDSSDQSATTRWNRRVLAYRALLTKAKFEAPSNLKAPFGKGLFGVPLTKAMQESQHDNAAEFAAGGKALEKLSEGKATSWDQLVNALQNLHSFITTKDSGWSDFNNKYLRTSSSGQSWADADLLGILGMIGAQNGAVRLRLMADRHSSSVEQDYAVGILKDLHTGRLVIIDQSLGDERLNQIVSDRIIDFIFKEHQRLFSTSQLPPQILVYVEEAHNRLPKGSETDATLIWPRVAKEGAKLKIGMVYATQEVSSIQKNILKNTSNWFIGHLNNTDETGELRRYYDFGDYEDSILRAQNPGFLRVKTRSNPYVIPVQIDQFVMPKEAPRAARA
jgi:Helicase HerA, central domain